MLGMGCEGQWFIRLDIPSYLLSVLHPDCSFLSKSIVSCMLMLLLFAEAWLPLRLNERLMALILVDLGAAPVMSVEQVYLTISITATDQLLVNNALLALHYALSIPNIELCSAPSPCDGLCPIKFSIFLSALLTKGRHLLYSTYTLVFFSCILYDIYIDN